MLRTNYKIVKEIIDKYDPMQLLSLSCPPDEYSQEAQIVANKISEFKMLNLFILKNIIADTFYGQFNISINDKICGKIASEIILTIEFDNA